MAKSSYFQICSRVFQKFLSFMDGPNMRFLAKVLVQGVVRQASSSVLPVRGLMLIVWPHNGLPL